MLQRALTYFVLALVVLQPAMAIGDAHQLHQSGAEHFVFDDAHLHDDGHISDAQADQSNLSETENGDCHHCCHCNGHFSAAALIAIERVDLAKHSSPVPNYSENTFPETYETFLRPPKA
ncbi:MAG: hypothetical protein CMK92_04365 [Pseudomonas sp.]|jgi:hypothetical protein|nr:hypothetical protein [Pseudomonas sp.]